MYPNINAELARHGMQKYELANRLNINRKTLGKWLNNGCIPAHALVKMSEIFGVSTDYLLGRENVN